ncbi:MAG: mechanosensitive ion channel [Rhodocyclaceae bacterium]|nr:mechanosensitive ion channel [Rhodocyclaceae bacterium]
MSQILLDAGRFFWRDEVPWVLAFAAVLALVALRAKAVQREAVAHTVGFFVLAVIGQFVAALLSALGFSMGGAVIYEMCLIGAGLALIRLAGLVGFRVVLARLALRMPLILEDILVILAYVAWGMVRLRYAGLDLTHIVTTSAVITAVLAFSMQDTLGNILGGLALQLDSSVRIGDWIKLDDISGRIVEIRWRSTAIETRNGETVVVPNSLLMKSKFTVIGSRRDDRPRWRRWIWINVDFNVAPARVISTVERALADAEIDALLRDPAPNCVLMEFGNTWCRYALRYWMDDPRRDDPTDSAVRTHVFAALQRAGIRLAEPEYGIKLTSENAEHRAVVRSREIERRVKALAALDLFAAFSKEELTAVAEHLVYAPFARGDVITRQGAIAHWLYLLSDGEVDVWFEPPQGPRRLLSTLNGGSVFGEMGLLTGEPRRATVTARTDCECYRLDKSGLQDIIQSRPAIAEEIAGILTKRELELDSLKQALTAAPARARRNEESFLDLIRGFFGLAD